MRRVSAALAGLTAALALAFLLFATTSIGQTYARWQHSETINLGEFRTGMLALTVSEMNWLSVTTDDYGDLIEIELPNLSNVELAGGLKVIGQALVTPELVGEMLTADIVSASSGMNIPEMYAPFITISASIMPDADNAFRDIPLDGAEHLLATVSDYQVTRPLVLQLEIEIAPELTQFSVIGEPLNLGELQFALRQVGGGWESHASVEFGELSFSRPDLELPDTIVPMPVPPYYRPPIAPIDPEFPPFPEVPNLPAPECPAGTVDRGVWYAAAQGGYYQPGDCIQYGERRFVAESTNSTGQIPGADPFGSWMEVGQLVTAPDGRVVHSWTPSWIYGRDSQHDVVAHNFDAETGQWLFFEFNGRGGPRGVEPDAGNLHGPWTLLEFGVAGAQ